MISISIPWIVLQGQSLFLAHLWIVSGGISKKQPVLRSLLFLDSLCVKQPWHPIEYVADKDQKPDKYKSNSRPWVISREFDGKKTQVGLLVVPLHNEGD